MQMRCSYLPDVSAHEPLFTYSRDDGQNRSLVNLTFLQDYKPLAPDVATIPMELLASD
jgi:hypothetical protein